MQNKVSGTGDWRSIIRDLNHIGPKGWLPAFHKNPTDHCSSLIFHKLANAAIIRKSRCDGRHTSIRAVKPSIAACAGVEAL
jgi:hypothetical protein